MMNLLVRFKRPTHMFSHYNPMFEIIALSNLVIYTYIVTRQTHSAITTRLARSVATNVRLWMTSKQSFSLLSSIRYFCSATTSAFTKTRWNQCRINVQLTRMFNSNVMASKIPNLFTSISSCSNQISVCRQIVSTAARTFLIFHSEYYSTKLLCLSSS